MVAAPPGSEKITGVIKKGNGAGRERLELSQRLDDLQMRADFLRGFFRGDDRMYFEGNEVTPVSDPLIEKRAILCFHQLVTTIKVVGYPA